VIRALSTLGKFKFLILILHRRSTSGRPTIDRTPETRIKTTIFLKNHKTAIKTKIPANISMFLKVVFIGYSFAYTNLIQFFGITYS
jgi:hypothetical protein